MTTETRTGADRAFFGHPRGLGYLVFAEAWERFSYYGMLALLALYISKQLLLPGHVENVVGFGAFRAFLSGVYGANTPLAIASAVAGLYGAAVYVTPLVGGFIADRLIGRTMAVTIGAVLMSIGHFLMAFEQSFLLALACLLAGVGLFKGNIASQVGELYEPGDLRRADAFQIYLIGISVAVIASPIVCGWLGQKVAWHWGFGAAGVGMLIGLAVYLSGRRWLPPDVIRKRGDHLERPKLAPGEGKTIAVLLLLVPVLAVSAVGNQQIFNAYELWGDAHYQLSFAGHTMPVSFLISFDAIVSTATLAGSVAFWRWWATKRREPDEIVKLTLGAFIACGAPLVLALASAQEAASGQKVGLIWALGFHLLNDIGFANLFPVGLALFSRASPKAVAGLMIGVYYLNLFFAGLGVAKLGGLLDKVSSAQFWLIHAGLIALGAVLLLIFWRLFGRILSPTVDPEALD
jgi:POT family proton-dependent oligopeptide transporter